MPRPHTAVPVPRNHKGRAVLDVYENGVRRIRTLGGWGTLEAEAEYKRFLAEFAAGRSDRLAGNDLTVNEVLLAFMQHADQHYRRADGTQTNEVVEYRILNRFVRELYGHVPAAEFGPLAVKAVRQRMVENDLARVLINNRIRRLKHVFKWAAGEELIPFEVYQRLTTVAGLQKGRTVARETAPVGPVADERVDAVLPFLNRHVRGLVEFQRLTGCRPAEACTVRRRDIDTGGPIWLYRPAHHKTTHRGKPRVIAIGPKAQAVLKEFFTPNLDDYLFIPRRAVEELHAGRSARRATQRYASHMRRNAAKRVADPKRRPAERYTTASYGHAIGRACDRAFPPPPPLAQREGETVAEWWGRLTHDQRAEVTAWRRAHRWHPNQLRHSFATLVRKHHGLEAAQVLLGHARADVTQVYAERDEQLSTRPGMRRMFHAPHLPHRHPAF